MDTADKYLDALKAVFDNNPGVRRAYFPANKSRRKTAILCLARDFGYGLTRYPEHDQKLAARRGWEQLVTSRCIDKTGVPCTKAEWLENIQIGHDRCISYPERYKSVLERNDEVRKTWTG
jgi:hypothetical protein